MAATNLGLPATSFLLGLKHNQVRQQIFTKSLEILLAHRSLIEILTQIFHCESQSDAKEDNDQLS